MFSGIEKVYSGVGLDGPVVVFTGSVNPCEGLLVKKTCKASLVRNLFHHFHGELVVIHRHICCLKNRSQLML